MPDKLEMIQSVIAPYVDVPLFVTKITNQNYIEDSTLAYAILSSSDHDELEIYVSDRLLNGPEEAMYYVTARQAFQFAQKDGKYMYYDYYPTSVQMGKIRQVLQTIREYPYREDASEVYSTLALDKFVREHSPFRLTKEIVAWRDAQPTHKPRLSWRGRMLIQKNEDSIWGKAR